MGCYSFFTTVKPVGIAIGGAGQVETSHLIVGVIVLGLAVIIISYFIIRR